MLKDIEEALRVKERGSFQKSVEANGLINKNAETWLRHLLSIISQKDEEIERLKDGLHRAVLLLDKYETMLGESPC